MEVRACVSVAVVVRPHRVIGVVKFPVHDKGDAGRGGISAEELLCRHLLPVLYRAIYPEGARVEELVAVGRPGCVSGEWYHGQLGVIPYGVGERHFKRGETAVSIL